MPTVIDLYERKVREIALLQCRCATGADIEIDLPKAEPEEVGAHPHAA